MGPHPAAGMAEVIEGNEDRILGGAHRFNAHYLLDSAQPLRALQAYRKVWQYFPEFALRRLNRIIFSFISLVGLGGLRRIIYRRYLVAPEKAAALNTGSATNEPAARSCSAPEPRRAKPRDVLPPILVTGVHRSSTTWVGKMLTANKQYVYVSEPLNVLHRRGVMRKPVAALVHLYLQSEMRMRCCPVFMRR